MKKRYKVLLSALVVGVLGSLAALGIFGAFSATTSNAGNEVSSGSVTLGDNDAGSALYFMSGAAPGDTVTKCIKVTYSGSIPAEVGLYTDDTAMGSLAQYVDLTVTQGTQATATFPDCTGFTPAAGGGALFNGTLMAFSTTYNTDATGIDSGPAVPGNAAWSQGASVVYRFQVTLDAAAPVAAENQTTGEHGFIWQADSQ